MKKRLIGCAAALCATPAFAFPDGAPWRSADPNAALNCTSCHFDGEAIKNSDQIYLSGVPASPKPNNDYLLGVLVTDARAEIAGYLLESSAGSFVPIVREQDPEPNAVRSLKPEQLVAYETEWRVVWTAPDEIPDRLVFLLAVNFADNDGSPFGDIIHFRTIEIPAHSDVSESP